MYKYLILFLASVVLSGVTFAIPAKKVDPFSKITIKSESATFQKNKGGNELYCLQYKDNVSVKFADNSKITAGILDIFLKKDKTKEVHKIVIRKNVLVRRSGQEAKADLAEIFVSDKLCKLKGNISITQRGDGKKNVPLKATCSSAQFKWSESEILLLGSRSKPVDTVIELADTLKRRAFVKDKKTNECDKNTSGSGGKKNSSR